MKRYDFYTVEQSEELRCLAFNRRKGELEDFCQRHNRNVSAVRCKLLEVRGRPMTFAELQASRK